MEFIFIDKENITFQRKSTKIKEISEILQRQQTPDLVEEKMNLLSHNPSEEKGAKQAEMDFSLINQLLPTEVLKKILEKLDFEGIRLAKLICTHWRDIIDGFKLVKQASSMFLEYCVKTDTMYIFDLNCFHF